MPKNAVKTNAMRLLEQAGVPFETGEYEPDESDLSAVHAAAELGIDPDRVFKTLVTRSEGKSLYVFCIPAPAELDLKKCAALAGEKRLEMIHVKELPALTGYIRGGCSPVGMKKKYPTWIDETAVLFETIYVSAGLRGHQLIVDPEALAAYLNAPLADLTKP